MKVLILFALVAFAAAEAEPEPEGDPQFLLNAGFPIAPIMSIKSEDAKPITYTIPSTGYPFGAFPYSAYPYTHSHFNTWPYLMPQIAKPAESARAKREAEAEADPQFLINPMTYSFGGATPLTYSAGAWPAASWSGAWPATWSGAAWPYHGLPIGYALAKKTE